MKRKRGFNGVQLPRLNPLEEVGCSIIENLYPMSEPLRPVVCFDRDKGALVKKWYDRSSDFFELLKEANLCRGTIIRFERKADGQLWTLTPDALARCNWALHISGYERGFRKWRRTLEALPGGQILWKQNRNVSLFFEFINAKWKLEK